MSAEGGTRRGEEIDIDAVGEWLRAQGVALDGWPEVTQFSGGASNWTYGLRYANRDLILRRPPDGTKARGAHDMRREFALQAALKPVYPGVPDMVALCTDAAVIGADFYVMDRIDGVIPRKDMPPEMAFSKAQARQLCIASLDKLVALHAIDVRGTPLETFGKGAGYVRRQIDGWCERFARVPTWNVMKLRRVQAWLHDNMPDDVGTGVVHNDWRFDNLVLANDDPTRIVGVLDWELATLGDPLMELGTVVAFWIEAGDGSIAQSMRPQPTHLPGMFTRREVIEHYLERSGRRCDRWTFYEVYGLFRLAAIMQQIYFRYHAGQTRNPKFRNFWIMINYLGWRCMRLIRAAR